jgi:probable rRNA maturation factor
MIKHEINIDIDPAFKTVLNVTRLKKGIKQILKITSTDEIVELSIVFTDDKTIQDLNKKYRNIDSPTDVLAFHMHSDNKDGSIPFVTPPDSVRHLGEVVISYPQAVRQAEDFKHDVEHEIIILLIHGILHLIGYDHELTDEEEIMRTKEIEILEKITLSGD